MADAKWQAGLAAATKCLSGESAIWKSNETLAKWSARMAAETIDAFATAALGPGGPAALRQWVEGEAVLVPVVPTEAMARAHFSAHAHAEAFHLAVPAVWAAMLAAAPKPAAASPATPDGG